MEVHEQQILEMLDAAVRNDMTRARIDRVVEALEQKLARDSAARMAWQSIPLSLYGERLPPEVLSSWVFILRAGATTGAERHPNSHQRVMSYRGTGDLQVRTAGRWCSHRLDSDPRAPLLDRWASIPANVWHQAVVPDENWVVVSFHTVEDRELIEERPDETDWEHTHQRRYLDMTKRETRSRDPHHPP
jgi:hypothetical protein